MWELDCEEGWAPKNWCFWTVVLEKTLESPLDCKEIQPVHPKGDQSWVFIGRTDVEAETPIIWPPDAKNWLTWKDPDAGKDWEQEKWMTEHDMVGWHHWLNAHGFGWTPGVGDGQGGLAYCGFWGRKESDTTERLNRTELKETAAFYVPTSAVWRLSFLHVALSACDGLFLLAILMLRSHISLWVFPPAILVGMKLYLIVALTYVSLRSNNVEHLFMYLAHLYTSLEKC